MARKYIEDITNIEDTPYGWSEYTGRNEFWQKQRETYGFDERETWNMNTSFMYWLYERLMMFKEIKSIDLTFHKFDINGIVMTQKECIDKMLDNCKEYITNKLVSMEREDELIKETLDIWKECIYAMWW